LYVVYRTQGTSGVLWLNAAETWVEVAGGARQSANVVSSIVNFVSGSGTQQPPLEARFFSESGIIDAFLFMGPTPLDVSSSYAKYTGVASLPPVSTYTCYRLNLMYIILCV
jgi:alpha 1,3-glucosidase